MWVVASVFICTVYAGCISFARAPDKADMWLVAATEQECVEGNLRTLRETVREMGDVLRIVHVTCESLGA